VSGQRQSNRPATARVPRVVSERPRPRKLDRTGGSCIASRGDLEPHNADAGEGRRRQGENGRAGISRNYRGIGFLGGVREGWESFEMAGKPVRRMERRTSAMWWRRRRRRRPAGIITAGAQTSGRASGERKGLGYPRVGLVYVRPGMRFGLIQSYLCACADVHIRHYSVC
jgi:hypothetical protein